MDLATLKPFIKNTLSARNTRKTKEIVSQKVISSLLADQRLLYDEATDDSCAVVTDVHEHAIGKALDDPLLLPSGFSALVVVG